MYSNEPFPLALNSIDTQLVEHDIKLLHQLILPHEAIPLEAKAIEYNALNAENKRLCDEGDLLPMWAFWWLELAAKVAYGDRFGPCRALIMATPKKDTIFKAFQASVAQNFTVQSLDVSDTCVALAQSSYSLGFIIAWGLQPQAINSPRFPLTCRGFVLPIIDGMGALYRATPEEKEWLKL
jgi:hypothetical protein